ncbi:MAG: hypothetical protein JSR68_02590 [Proteobacteria bacterium]|nr:hypothetical protein [Pseudomonadota bacterium]
MSNDKKPLNEGYRPERIEKGYQPAKPLSQPDGPKPQGGYQPTTGHGTNPTSNPPGRE